METASQRAEGRVGDRYSGGLGVRAAGSLVLSSVALKRDSATGIGLAPGGGRIELSGGAHSLQCPGAAVSEERTRAMVVMAIMPTVGVDLSVYAASWARYTQGKYACYSDSNAYSIILHTAAGARWLCRCWHGISGSCLRQGCL